jgi:hypothetical protein
MSREKKARATSAAIARMPSNIPMLLASMWRSAPTIGR